MQKIDLPTLKRLLCEEKVALTLLSGKKQVELYWDKFISIGGETKKKKREKFSLFLDDKKTEFPDYESILPFLRKKGFIDKNNVCTLLDIEQQFTSVEEYENYRDPNEMTFAEKIAYFREKGCDRLTFCLPCKQDRLSKEDWEKADMPFSQMNDKVLNTIYHSKLNGIPNLPSLNDLEQTLCSLIEKKQHLEWLQKALQNNYFIFYGCCEEKISRTAYLSEGKPYQEKTDEQRMEEDGLIVLQPFLLHSEYSFMTNDPSKFFSHKDILIKKFFFSLTDNNMDLLSRIEKESKNIVLYEFFAGEKLMGSFI